MGNTRVYHEAEPSYIIAWHVYVILKELCRVMAAGLALYIVGSVYTWGFGYRIRIVSTYQAYGGSLGPACKIP